MNSCYLPDIQAKEPKIQIQLNRVGVTNVKKLITLFDNNESISLYPTFDLFVDLPSSRKGANLSRNIEALDRIIEIYKDNNNYKLDHLCNNIAIQLLNSHEYAKTSEVNMKCEYVINQKSPSSNIKNQKFIDLFFTSIAEKKYNSIETTNIIGVKVIGMTACPCAQSMILDYSKKYLLNLGIDESIISNIIKNIPMATHNQRGQGIISIKIKNEKYNIDIKSLVKVIENSMSSNIYEILKRADEKIVVENAHKNPKFVEDCVRTMAENIVTAFPNLPDDAIISIKQINEESIHKHNAYAEIIDSFGSIKSKI